MLVWAWSPAWCGFYFDTSRLSFLFLSFLHWCRLVEGTCWLCGFQNNCLANVWCLYVLTCSWETSDARFGVFMCWHAINRHRMLAFRILITNYRLCHVWKYWARARHRLGFSDKVNWWTVVFFSVLVRVALITHRGRLIWKSSLCACTRPLNLVRWIVRPLFQMMLVCCGLQISFY